ncbi:Myb-like protein L [Grifola frondosa]|uniref:Myb-like protein L n=1 Tax=Grifola frondosa TaxID=5627 RepID=A0A1C7MY08_GRIFR|nr:Myb-like protein L [Grifola frondosa]
MSESRVGKPWTPYEDNLLTQAVAIYGENESWKSVALSVPGRTNKACRKVDFPLALSFVDHITKTYSQRWLHSLSPSVKKSAWTTEEDQLLLSLYAIHSTRWSVIARHISGRTDDACSKRYREALDPSLKRDDWTADEDARLLDVYARIGGKWGQVGQELNRSGLGCRNRWRMLERKKAALVREGASRDETPCIPSVQRLPESGIQWTSLSVDSTQFWNERGLQYISPDAHLPTGISAGDVHSPQFFPAEFLSSDAPQSAQPNAPDQPLFQYTSSSLSAALSNHALSQSPHTHGYCTPTYSADQDMDVHSLLSLSESRRSPYNNDEHEFMTMHGPNHAGFEQEYNSTTFSPHSSGAVLSATLDSQSGDMELQVNIACTHSPSDAPSSATVDTQPLPCSPRPSDQTERVPQLLSVEVPTAPANPSRHYRTAAQKPPGPTAVHKPIDPQNTSKALFEPASYFRFFHIGVCVWTSGMRPDDAPESKSCFVTSKELSTHSKVDHSGDLGGSRPFRCGLPGCDKSWKSINGLQYHLQLSKFHFQQALLTKQTSVEEPHKLQKSKEGRTPPLISRRSCILVRILIVAKNTSNSVGSDIICPMWVAPSIES